MAKRSRSSRSERKAERARAEQAREHGLPAAEPSRRAARAAQASGTDELEAPDSWAASAGKRRQDPGKRSSGPPALVWVVGGGLAILVVVYVLSRLRAP